MEEVNFWWTTGESSDVGGEETITLGRLCCCGMDELLSDAA